MEIRDHGWWDRNDWASISADLVRRLPRQNKKQREGLATLVATMLDVRCANLMDLAASLPREAERIDMRYQWISRLLGNEHIDVDWSWRRSHVRFSHEPPRTGVDLS